MFVSPLDRSAPSQWTDCTIIGRHFESVSVPAHVHHKYKILAAQENSSLEFALISGRKEDAIPVSFFCRVNFHTVIKAKQRSVPKN